MKINLPFSVQATDISERILARAKAGSYTQLEVQRGLPAPYLVKYFGKNDQDMWSASAELMAHIHYKKLNLLDPFSFPKKFNIILCRNVLIYQNLKSKIAILNKVTEMLAPGGFLILGSGESLFGLSNDYVQVASDGAVIYTKREKAPVAASLNPVSG